MFSHCTYFRMWHIKLKFVYGILVASILWLIATIQNTWKGVNELGCVCYWFYHLTTSNRCFTEDTVKAYQNCSGFLWKHTHVWLEAQRCRTVVMYHNVYNFNGVISMKCGLNGITEQCDYGREYWVWSPTPLVLCVWIALVGDIWPCVYVFAHVGHQPHFPGLSPPCKLSHKGTGNVCLVEVKLAQLSTGFGVYHLNKPDWLLLNNSIDKGQIVHTWEVLLEIIWCQQNGLGH